MKEINQIEFRGEDGQRYTVVISVENVKHQSSALVELWHEQGDYILIFVLFLATFAASLWVTGWF